MVFWGCGFCAATCSSSPAHIMPHSAPCFTFREWRMNGMVLVALLRVSSRNACRQRRCQNNNRCCFRQNFGTSGTLFSEGGGGLVEWVGPRKRPFGTPVAEQMVGLDQCLVLCRCLLRSRISFSCSRTSRPKRSHFRTSPRSVLSYISFCAACWRRMCCCVSQALRCSSHSLCAVLCALGST